MSEIVETNYCVGTVRQSWDGPWISVSMDHYDTEENPAEALAEAQRDADEMTRVMGQPYKVFKVTHTYTEVTECPDSSSTMTPTL